MAYLYSNAFRVLLLNSLLYVSLLSCTSSPTNSSVSSDKKSAEGSAAPFSEKIIGHWATKSRGTDYYIGVDTIFMFEGVRVRKFKYTITEFNEAEKTMSIQTLTPAGFGHKKQLIFAPNFKSLTEKNSIELNGNTTEFSTTWIYVGAETYTENKSLLDFRAGVVEGCSSRMREKGNAESTIKMFCSCFSETLVDDISIDDVKKLTAGDKTMESTLMMRNGYKLLMCEKNLPKDAKF